MSFSGDPIPFGVPSVVVQNQRWLSIAADFSQAVGVTPVGILPPLSGDVVYVRLWSVSPVNGPTIWLSRTSTTPAPNSPGSFPLAPGEFEEFKYPAAIPVNSLFAVATAAGAALTVEVGSVR
jgi:hypothetical protein